MESSKSAKSAPWSCVVIVLVLSMLSRRSLWTLCFDRFLIRAPTSAVGDDLRAASAPLPLVGDSCRRMTPRCREGFPRCALDFSNLPNVREHGPVPIDDGGRGRDRCGGAMRDVPSAAGRMWSQGTSAGRRWRRHMCSSTSSEANGRDQSVRHRGVAAVVIRKDHVRVRQRRRSGKRWVRLLLPAMVKVCSFHGSHGAWCSLQAAADQTLCGIQMKAAAVCAVAIGSRLNLSRGRQVAPRINRLLGRVFPILSCPRTLETAQSGMSIKRLPGRTPWN